MTNDSAAVRALEAVAPVRQAEPLSRHTTFAIGGPADLYMRLATIDALVSVLKIAHHRGLPWCILGAGSNVLVGDRGIRGLVVEYDARTIDAPQQQPDGGLRVRVEAGASFATVARRLSREGYTGVEWAVGIPGTLGGAVVTNAGAHGGDLAANLASATLIRAGQEPEEVAPDCLGLAYRESAFTRGELRDVAVAAVTLIVRRADPAQTMALVAQYEAHRTTAQPPGRNSGSMFRNPAGDSAWRLIDAVGLRGARCGGAQISPKHTNFFANTGGARAAEVKLLMDEAATRVRARFGIELEPEVRLIGEGFDLPPEQRRIELPEAAR